MKVDIGHQNSSAWQVYVDIDGHVFWNQDMFDTPADAIKLRDLILACLGDTNLPMPSVHKYTPKTFHGQSPCSICGRKQGDPVHNLT